MKHIPTLVNAVLAAVLILLVLSTGLPNFNVQAAATTPTVTADPTTEVATAKDSAGLPVRDEIEVGRYSGRAKYVVK